VALRIGLIGIVGAEMKADPWGTLTRVAEIGYEGMEGAAGVARRAGISVEEAKAKLDELGLAAVAQGGSFQKGDDEKLKEAIAGAKASGARYVVTYWAPCESRDQVLAHAEVLNGFGALCREEGLRFCYHNHNQEFAAFDGEYGLDILMANTDPDDVLLELDVAWVTYGGADPSTMIHKYADRCPILHIKDLAVVPEGGDTGNDSRSETQFTEVGTGVVDIAGSVAAARDCGVEWLVVEQDRMRDLEPMDSIHVSYDNLKRIVG
jgi:sugar phosphate isomerase/epimerase